MNVNGTLSRRSVTRCSNTQASSSLRFQTSWTQHDSTSFNSRGRPPSRSTTSTNVAPCPVHSTVQLMISSAHHNETHGRLPMHECTFDVHQWEKNLTNLLTLEDRSRI